MTKKEICPPDKSERAIAGEKRTHGIEISVHVQTGELDLALSKAKKLSEIMMEAKTLADEIASINVGLKLDI